MKRAFKFNLKDKSTKVMTFDQFARWACFIEAMDTIFAKCDSLGIDIDSDDSWCKPLVIKKYIDERFHAMKHDLEVETKLGTFD